MAGRNTKRIVAAVVALGVIGAAWYYFGPLVGFLNRTGYLEGTTRRTYKGDSVANLKAIQTAIMSYYDSEGQFPDGSGWMDEAFNRMKTADMADSETKKKLHGPSGGESGFGYSFNEALSQKTKSEAGDPATTVLAYESHDAAWNAHGDPGAEAKIDPQAKAVTLDGQVKSLADLPKAAATKGP
ncbi:MAG: hypothetical protein KF857_09325 [Fimbriimonadaceae bacterium]|nr:hypothetical protein [Fimbriimonadaceae bacterium]